MNVSQKRPQPRGGASHPVAQAVRMFLKVAAATAIPAVSALAQAPAEEPSEVVVTGSRIVRDGMTAPTPVSVLGADRLEQRAATNIGDMLNELPSFRASSTPATGASNGYVGGRILDLRGLGAPRTLVLVDGKRFVASTTAGTVDTNMIPSILLERAEVVTGGASAAYGSDAVAGVVNFLLNENLDGLRSSVEYSQSNYSDNETQSAKLAGGTSLWDGRGHFIGAIEYEKSDGVSGCIARDWCAEGWNNIGRPNLASGLPANNILPNGKESTISPTGVVNGPGALRGITFNPDGTPRRFVYGNPASAVWMAGGEGGPMNATFSGSPLIAPNERYTAYTRTKFEFTDSLTGRFDLSFGHVEGETAARQLYGTGYTISANNPYIPRSSDPSLDIPTLLAAGGLTSFTFGRNFAEFGYPEVSSRNDVVRAVASLAGDLAGSWTWDASYQVGRNDFRSTAVGVGINARVTNGLNAVRNGAGQIVCAINANVSTADDDPTCIPINPFGNQLDPRLADYLRGTAIQTNVTTQHAVAGNVQGELFSTWAGPISVASGIEFRSDKMAGDADPISQALGFYTNNASSISGKVKVTEGYLETIVPLATDMAFAESLELNGAVRRTMYEREGAGTSSDVYATTWKIGSVWQPVRSLRFRATRSRDIRAPNVSEMFGPTTRGFGILSDPGDPLIPGSQQNPVVISGSNPNLVPEVADTWTVGFVIQPNVDGFLGRTQLSIDYYDIQIEDAIGVLGAQTIATRCFEGAVEFCPLITRNSAGVIQQVQDVRQNVDELITKGYDLEFSYRHPAEAWGEVDFRLLATYALDLVTLDSAGSIDRAGQTGLRAGTPGGVPEYTLDGMLNWSLGPWQTSFHSRYIPSGKYNAAFIGPDEPGYNIALTNSSNLNTVRDAWYFDIVGQYDFSRANDGSFILFAAVNNVGNQDPTRTPGANTVGNNVLFDPIGRTYKLGLRVRY